MSNPTLPEPIALHHITQAALAQLPQCVAHCDQSVQQFTAAHAQCRARLAPQIRTRQDAPVLPLSAVDGTHDLIETHGISFLLLVAVAVRDTTPVAQQTRVLLVPPVTDPDELAGDLRARLELHLLAERIRHDPASLHLLDGSLLTLFLALRRLLRRHASDQRAGRPDWWSSVPGLLDRAQVLDDWLTLLTCDHLVAHAKRVTAARMVQALGDLLPTPLCSDAVLFSLVLEPGEYLTPTPLLARSLHLREPFWHLDGTDRQRLADAFARWHLTYARFRSWGAALRLEVPGQPDAPLLRQLATLDAALPGADILEPLPQYLADAMLNGQRQVLAAVVQGVHTTLRRTWSSEIVRAWLGDWRTQR